KAVNGRSVLIKANLLTAHAPEKAATTHPAVVSALASRLYAEGATSVVIGDSPGGIFTKSSLDLVYKATGMMKAAEESGATLNYQTDEADVTSKNGKKTMRLAAYVRSADVVISFAKLKTHTYARMTAAVKNLYGAVAGLEKAKYHAKIPDRAKFAKLLCDICNTVAPDFSLIDGILGMEGKGPGTGDPKWANCLIAAQNPYCADLAAATIIGMPINRVPTIVEGIRRGYSPSGAEGLIVKGLSLEQAAVRFVPPPYMKDVGLLSLLPGSLKDPVAKYLEAYPIITDKCVGCGECARACPKHTIKIRDKKAVIDYSQCIKCYCCHEMCRLKAIELKKRLFLPKNV
ncbi:MAG: DUF362 domain-containing protein, partial [Clostridia bacterium]|nr:DUF362 domain-containing protein [Clostridia bacterium]